MPMDEIMEEIKRILRELAESQKRTDQEIKALTKKTDQEIGKVNKMVGDLTDGWGKFVEGLIEPSAVELAAQLGINVKRVYRRVEAKRGREKIEVDLIIEGEKDNKGVLLVVEAKSHFEPDDMEDFLSWFLEFFEFFDIYKGYEVMGVVASSRFGDGVDRRAQREGLWVLVPAGDLMKVINPKGFKPKVLM
jgi:hypothetical protein